MSICASGASVAKPGVNSAVRVDAQYMQSILPSSVAWVFPYLPYAKSLYIGNVATFCSLDPPSFSLPTPLEIASFIAGFNIESNPLGVASNYNIVNDFIENLVQRYLWYSLCQCSSGATPAPPPGPAAPANLPGINPPSLVTPAVQAACYSYASPTSAALTQGASYFGNSFRRVGLGDAYAQQPPQGRRATAVRIVGRLTGVTSPFPSIRLSPTFVTFAGAPIQVGTPQQTITNASRLFDITYPFPSNADSYSTLQEWLSGTGTSKLDITEELWCDGAYPGGVASPCCPPDPVATALLSRILDMTTLIQRQAVPFAYVPGGVHAGLSGHGSVAIAPCVAALVTVTASGLGELSDIIGTPDTIYNAGWINWGTPDGFLGREWISGFTYISVPPDGGMFTRIGYSLAPGTVVTISELVREP